jgi:hypothetical protein
MGSWLSCGVGLRSWSRVRLLLRLLMRCGLTCTRILELFTSGCFVYTSLGVGALLKVLGLYKIL